MATGLWGGPLNSLPKGVVERIKRLKEDHSVDWITFVDEENGHNWLIAKLYYEATEFRIVATKIEFESDFISTLADKLSI